MDLWLCEREPYRTIDTGSLQQTQSGRHRRHAGDLSFRHRRHYRQHVDADYRRQLGGLELYSWVFSIYMLTSALTTPIFGKLADLFSNAA